MTWGADVLIGAAISGVAVVAMTWFADRIGGSAGGLLATAPVTTTAAFLFLAFAEGPGALHERILVGGSSLFAAIAPMPVYFYAAKWTRQLALPARIGIAILAYVACFTGLTWTLPMATPPGWERLWFVAVCLLVLLFWYTFMRVRIDPEQLRGPKPPLTKREVAARFLSGVAVILLVRWVGALEPSLAAAWAVFPGVFLVTLAVLGLGHGAAFSARAAQAASLGGVPLALFLITYWFLLPIGDSFAWAIVAMLPAWGAYFGALVPLYRVRKQAYAY